MAVSFPAPIGGVPFEEDFTPSVVFACAFAVIVLVGLFRLARKSTRTLVILGPLIFCIERVVVWSLRAKQAKTPSEDLDRNLTIYWQISFAAAYMSIWGTLVNILRCVLVATTRGNDPGHHATPLVFKEQGPYDPVTYDTEAEAQIDGYAPLAKEDKPHVRFWYRRIFGGLAFAMWVPTITGLVMGYNYVNAETDPSKGQTVQVLRYLTTGIAFGLLIALHVASLYGLVAVRGVNKHAIFILFAIGAVLLILPIYELIAINNWTTSLVSTAPGSQNTHGEKVAFYVVRAAPEAVASVILLSLDVKNIFGTGLLGDRFRDAKDEKH